MVIYSLHNLYKKALIVFGIWPKFLCSLQIKPLGVSLKFTKHDDILEMTKCILKSTTSFGRPNNCQLTFPLMSQLFKYLSQKTQKSKFLSDTQSQILVTNELIHNKKTIHSSNGKQCSQYHYSTKFTAIIYNQSAIKNYINRNLNLQPNLNQTVQFNLNGAKTLNLSVPKQTVIR